MTMPQTPSRSYLLRHLWEALRRGRQTVDFPAGEPDIASTYQGRLTVAIERCRGCGLCVRVCPAAALELTRLDGGGLRMAVHHQRCAVCGLCELACPADAIWRLATFAGASDDLAQLTDTFERPGGRTNGDQGSAPDLSL